MNFVFKVIQWAPGSSTQNLFRQVRASAEYLRDRVGRYVFISAVSVYGSPASGPVLLVHFGMTGDLVWSRQEPERHRHDRLALVFDQLVLPEVGDERGEGQAHALTVGSTGAGRCLSAGACGRGGGAFTFLCDRPLCPARLSRLNRR